MTASCVPETSQAGCAAVFLYALRQHHGFTISQPLCIVGHPRDRFTRSYLHFGVLVQPFIRSLHKLPTTHDYATLRYSSHWNKRLRFYLYVYSFILFHQTLV